MTQSIIDNLIGNFDLALKTLVPGSVHASRPNPGAKGAADLSDEEKKHAAGLMRINHTGEVCAQALYQGQALTARLPEVRDSMQHAADEEIDHLSWCEDRLVELESRPSLFNPIWYGLSFGLGAAAGLAGDKWSLGFVAETEKQVCQHLEDHLAKIPEQDSKSKAILSQMLEDEGRHADNAEAAGAAQGGNEVRYLDAKLGLVTKAEPARDAGGPDLAVGPEPTGVDDSCLESPLDDDAAVSGGTGALAHARAVGGQVRGQCGAGEESREEKHGDLGREWTTWALGDYRLRLGSGAPVRAGGTSWLRRGVCVRAVGRAGSQGATPQVWLTTFPRALAAGSLCASWAAGRWRRCSCVKDLMARPRR